MASRYVGNSESVMKCKINFDGNWREVPDSFCTLLGYSEDELLDRTFVDVTHPDDQAGTSELFDKLEDGELQEFDLQNRFMKKEGELVCVNISGAVIRDKQGEPEHILCYIQNPSKTLETKERLQETEQHFRSLFEHNPHPVYYFDLEGNFEGVNEKLVEFTGYSREELLGLNFRSFIVEEDLERTVKQFDKALDGESGEYQIQVKVKGGEKKDIRVTKFPMYVGEEVKGVFGILQDITKEKKWKRDLQKSQERWHRLVEDNPQPVQIVQDGQIKFMNKAGLELYGASDIDELLGKKVSAFCHPDYRDVLNKRKEKLENSRSIDPGELVMIRIDGEERFVEAHSIPITFRGEDAIQTVLHDITERKRAEEALKRNEKWMSKLFSNLPGIAYRCKNKPGWPMLFLSEGCRELTGYEPKTLTDGTGHDICYGDLIHEEDQEDLWEAVQQAVQEQESFEVEYRIRDKQGQVKWVWERGVAISYGPGDDILLEGFISDISQQKIAQKRMRESLREKEVLLQEIHHRVKNNLAVISGLLELQAMSTEDEVTLNTLRESQMRIQSMAMIHQKLYQSEALSNIGFDHYVKELIQTIENTYNFDGQDVSVEFDMDPVKLNVNQAIPSALILNELVTNSFKHAFKGKDKGSVSINLHQDEDRVKLKVIDDGKGLGPDFNIETQQSLGMTLVHTLTQQLEGELEFYSGNGVGGTEVMLSFNAE